MKSLLFLNLITPIVLFLVGIILKKHPVSDIGSHNGYNIPGARKSQAHWDYTQSIGPGITFRFGGIALGVEVLLIALSWVMDLDAGISLGIGMGLGFLIIILMFVRTEQCIKEKFGD